MCIFYSSNAKPETIFIDILYWSRFRMRVIGRCDRDAGQISANTKNCNINGKKKKNQIKSHLKKKSTLIQLECTWHFRAS